MIELDQMTEYFEAEFGRFKNPPTHAQLVFMRWAMPLPTMDHRDPGYKLMLRPHIEAVYVFGRLDSNGEFVQTPDDGRHMPAHTAVDFSDYQTEPIVNTKGEVLDDEEMLTRREGWKRLVAIKETLLAHHEGPHPDDPTQRVPSQHPKNRFSEGDLDIVFSHTDSRLRGKAC